jgi:hypothetical protein
MSDTVRVRAKATGVIREVSKEDAKALLEWRNEDGAEVWERVEEDEG